MNPRMAMIMFFDAFGRPNHVLYQHVLRYLIVGLIHLSLSPPPSSYRDSLVKLFTTMGSLTALDLRPPMDGLGA